MKKSKDIILTTVMFTAISSCSSESKPKDEWSYGKDQSGRARDTAVYRDGRYHYYRYYGGGWYVLNRNNMINTGAYMPASSSEIVHPTFAPRAAVGSIRSGGFGSSAHASNGG